MQHPNVARNMDQRQGCRARGRGGFQFRASGATRGHGVGTSEERSIFFHSRLENDAILKYVSLIIISLIYSRRIISDSFIRVRFTKERTKRQTKKGNVPVRM